MPASCGKDSTCDVKGTGVCCRYDAAGKCAADPADSSAAAEACERTGGGVSEDAVQRILHRLEHGAGIREMRGSLVDVLAVHAGTQVGARPSHFHATPRHHAHGWLELHFTSASPYHTAELYES